MNAACGHAAPESAQPLIPCEVCGARLCDDCWHAAPVCSGCGGAICTTCAPLAAQREGPKGTQYLTPRCQTREMKARRALQESIMKASASLALGHWSDVITGHLQDGIRIASRDGAL